MEKNIIQIDEEETRPLAQLPRQQRRADEEEPKKTSFFAGRNKLPIILVGITCAIVVLFPSWIIQPKNLQTVTSRMKMNLRQHQDTSYVEEELAAQIPSCAKHTFLTLHKQQPEGVVEETDSGNFCKGMLLRDDIILTTHECSQSTYLFESMRGSRVFVLKATPHTALNANMGLRSKLGFLQAKDVPLHYIFLDRPVRRARMFLSLRSHLDDIIAAAADNDAYNNKWGSSSSSSISPYITCKGYRPIAHNFPLPNGEMVPIGEELLTVGLPKDILWEHADLETASALENDDKERWWTKAITLAEGEALFQGYFDRPEIYGPEGSLSIVRAHGSFQGKASGICEAFDPRGHRRDVCFYNYVIRWKEQKPFSGMHFFDWLDYGAGKALFERNKMCNFLPYLNDDMLSNASDEVCVKKYFNAKTVHYFNDTEREAHEIYLSPSEDGQEIIARYKQSDEMVGESPDDDSHLFMFDLKKRMYIVDKNIWDDKKYGTIKHTAVLAGSPTLAAGEAYFKKHGAIGGIDYDSGHYRPNISAVAMMYQWVKDQGYNTSALNWLARSSWSTKDCDDIDWKGMEIGVFDASVLEKACQEVTKSPTWMSYMDDDE